MIEKMKWLREPEDYKITEKCIEVTTMPHTDLWQRTYYHFRNDNAPVLQMETDDKFFSFMVKPDFTDSHHRFDQCGIVMYLDSENWLKASVEYENEEFQHLGSVVTNHGYSDWAIMAIPAVVKQHIEQHIGQHIQEQNSILNLLDTKEISSKMKSNITKLYEAFGMEKIFGRSDVKANLSILYKPAVER